MNTRSLHYFKDITLITYLLRRKSLLDSTGHHTVVQNGIQSACAFHYSAVNIVFSCPPQTKPSTTSIQDAFAEDTEYDKKKKQVARFTLTHSSTHAITHLHEHNGNKQQSLQWFFFSFADQEKATQSTSSWCLGKLHKINFSSHPKIHFLGAILVQR